MKTRIMRIDARRAARPAALSLSLVALCVAGTSSAAEVCLGGGAVVISTGTSIFGGGGDGGGDFPGPDGEFEGDFPPDFDGPIELQTVVLEDGEGPVPLDEENPVPLPVEIGEEGEPEVVDTVDISEASLSQSFVVQPGYQTISGRVRFLSNEYPTYYQSQYNDAYVVRYATQGASEVLLSNNVNSISVSDWTAQPGVLGFNAGAPERTYSFDVSGLVGQTVSLFFEVRDVGDTVVDSALVIDSIVLDGTVNGQPIDPCS